MQYYNNLPTLKEKFSLYQCKIKGHFQSPVIRICIEPDCKAHPLCCEHCIKEDHREHLYENLIKIKRLEQLNELNLQPCFDSIEKSQNKFLNTFFFIIEKMKKIDFLQQINEKPSTELLEFISQCLKHKVNYSEFHQQVCQILNQIEQSFSILQQIFEEKFRYICQNQIEVMNQKASELLRQSRFKEIKSYTNKILSLDDRNIEANLIEAKSSKLQKKYQESLEYLAKVLEYQPNNFAALSLKVECLQHTDQTNEVLKLAQEIIQKYPNQIIGYFQMAEKLRMLEQFQDSLVYANRGLEINPENIDLLYTKSCSLKMLKNYPEAAKIGRQIKKLNPKFIEAQVILVSSLCKLNEFDEALKLCEEILIINPKHRVALKLKVDILRLLGRFEESVKIGEQLLEQDKQNIGLLCTVATSYIGLNLKEKAEYYLKKVDEVDPDKIQQKTTRIKIANQLKNIY